ARWWSTLSKAHAGFAYGDCSILLKCPPYAARVSFGGVCAKILSIFCLTSDGLAAFLPIALFPELKSSQRLSRTLSPTVPIKLWDWASLAIDHLLPIFPHVSWA